MKTALLAIATVLLAAILAPAASAEVSFNFAYSNLSQHGSWLVSAQYGHVWQPREYNRDWNPYYDGHWVYTNMGWAWVSDYQWGAIPYHYGTWISEPNVGWVWIPGRIWAPSWVVFRTGSDYIGWAPVPPGFSIGMSIDMGGPSSFVYVSSRNFLAPRLRASIIPRDRTSVFINNTTVVNNIVIQNNVVVNHGPDYRVVERATGRTIRQEPIENVARVAPFEHVSRAELAVDPARVKHGVRVAEPVPASEPLPVSDKRGNREENTSAAHAPKPSNGRPSAQPNTQEPATPAAAVIPTGAADTSQKAPSAQTPPEKEKAIVEQGARDQANAKAKAEQGAKDQANAKAKADQSAKAQANAKAKADQSAKAQANAKAKADQSAKAQANAKAKADQSAKAQANAKAQADAKAKKAKEQKPEPDKKDPGSEKDTTPGTKEETP